jgi:hypothetical protein
MDTSFISVELFLREKYCYSVGNCQGNTRSSICSKMFSVKNDFVLIPSVWSSYGRFSGSVLVAFLHHFFSVIYKKVKRFLSLLQTTYCCSFFMQRPLCLMDEMFRYKSFCDFLILR